MSDSAKRKRKGPSETPREVLGSLPAHRPQRVTARRLSTRTSATNGAAAAGAEAGRAPSGERTRARAPKPATQTAAQTVIARAPTQGFESEEIPLDAALQPPGTTQLLGSALELSLAAARGTLRGVGRLLAGTFERLPRP